MRLSAKDLPDRGAIVEQPPCPLGGRNSCKAWERGFHWRCMFQTPPEGQVAPVTGPYHHKGLAECFAIGWALADRTIQRLRTEVPV